MAAFASVWVGLLVEAVVVFVALNHYVIARRALEQRTSGFEAPSEADALLVLALVPMIRIVSVAMADDAFSPLTQYAVVGAPLLAAAGWAAVVVGPPPILALLRAPSWLLQAAIGLSGVPLGLGAFLILRPAPLWEHLTAVRVVWGSFVVLVFAALLEEVVFRGLVQNAFCALYGRGGLLVSTVLFTAVYLGARPAYIPFVATVGLAFAWLVQRTRSLVGVVLAHALLVIGLIIVWPAVLD